MQVPFYHQISSKLNGIIICLHRSSLLMLQEFLQQDIYYTMNSRHPSKKSLTPNLQLWTDLKKTRKRDSHKERVNACPDRSIRMHDTRKRGA